MSIFFIWFPPSWHSAPGRGAGLEQAALFLRAQRPIADGDLEDRPRDFLAAPAVILFVVDEALVAEAGAVKASHPSVMMPIMPLGAGNLWRGAWAMPRCRPSQSFLAVPFHQKLSSEVGTLPFLSSAGVSRRIRAPPVSMRRSRR
jgi:hypothetical protein